MKMMSLADKHSMPKPVTHQVYYSLTDRDFEWELMPLGLDQDIGTLVWSPLAGAKLSGKVGRTKKPPADSRSATDASWDVPEERLFAITDALESISSEIGHSIHASHWHGCCPGRRFQRSSSAPEPWHSLRTTWRPRRSGSPVSRSQGSTKRRSPAGIPVLASARDFSDAEPASGGVSAARVAAHH